VPMGAPPKPVAETVDLLGQRLLLDHSAGPWLRTAILRAIPPGRWRALPCALRAGRGTARGRAALRARAAPVAEQMQVRVTACHECVPGAPSPSLRLRYR
jgi:hypothetical protein